MRAVERAMDDLDIPRATAAYGPFVDTLNNWYIRRSRARFWGTTERATREAAFDTLYTVLVQTSKIMAPLMPIVAEKLYKSLTGERSVHLALWPEDDAFAQDHDLSRSMDLVRSACSAALAVRERYRLRVRLPLKSMTLVHADAGAMAPFTGLIAEEINVREVRLSTDLEAHGSLELKVNPRIGKRLGKKMKEVMAAAREGGFTLNDDGTAEVAGERLAADEFEMRVVTAEGIAAEPFAGTGAIVLDISVDEDQEAEGLARDLNREIQTARKEMDLDLSERISIRYDASERWAKVIEAHAAFLKSEALASAIVREQGLKAGRQVKLGGETVRLTIEKAAG